MILIRRCAYCRRWLGWKWGLLWHWPFFTCGYTDTICPECLKEEEASWSKE